jgi:cysteine synthase
MTNPFGSIKDKVIIAMIEEICRKKRIKPESLIEHLVKSEYQKLK